ncbi:FAD-dependent oxidoreductase, partial [Clostridium uliginosum]
VCLEDKDTIPAPASEVIEALEEGVEIITGASPKEINATWIHVSGVTFKKVSKMGVDESGKFVVETIEDSDFEIPCDTVIFATGQKVDVATMTRKSNLALLPNGKIAIDENMKTNIPKVFACGDAAFGSKCSVVYAMASGRKAALAIDNMIWDRELDLNVEHVLHKAPISEMLYPVRFERLYPQKVKRIKEFEEFEEVEISFTKKQAQLEARRCMKCGYEKVTSDSCIGCGVCAANCPQNAITMVNPNLKEGK